MCDIDLCVFDFWSPANGWDVLFGGAFAVLSAVIAVVLALWVQRRDFEKRTIEMNKSTEAAKSLARDQWRRHIIEESLELLTQCQTLALNTNMSTPRRTTIALELGAITMLFAADPEPYGRLVGQWFENQARFVLAAGNGENPAGAVEGISAQIVFGLIQWFQGDWTSKSFETR